MQDKAQIIKIAKNVRKWAERKARRDRFRDSLCGLCAIASAQLFKELVNHGFSPKIHQSNGGWGSHVFVTVNGFLVDVTATQFEIDDEVVVKRYRRSAKWFWNKDITFANVESLAKHQKDTGWTREQCVKIK